MKVSFDKNNYKKIERLNDRVTVVTLTGVIISPQAVKTAINGNNAIYEWRNDHNNPKLVGVSSWKWIIEAKGKAIRANDDADDPILAERIAECRAKIKIYYFMVKLIDKCIKKYIKDLFGNANFTSIAPMPKDSLYGIYHKYKNLLGRENAHLQELLSK